MSKVKLDKVQRNTLQLFQGGFNLFITGSAGTGKSFLIKQLIKSYLENNPDFPDGMSVTSTTGLSSLNINGKTIHSWSGMTPKDNLDDLERFIQTTKQNHKRLNNWLYTKVLVIDEISMLEAKLLDFLDKVARNIRNCQKPFGGIQVILTGDFYQLPPVCKNSFQEIPFSFNAECWDNLVDYTICLKKNHRQAEKELVNFLNYVRRGKINDLVTIQLEKYHTNKNYNDDYTHLYPNVSEVEAHNMLKLDQLPGITSNYTARLKPKPNKPSEFNLFPKDSVIVETLTLKPGAFIIINKNIDSEKGLVNGRQGIYQGTNSNGNLVIKTSDGLIHSISKANWEFPNFYIEQFPIRLAWALTIHKSQGMGIERLSVDIGDNVFSDGQAYVALSRATNSEYLHIKNYQIKAINVNAKVNQFYQRLEELENQWNKCQDHEGKIYYENKLNGFTSWKLPQDAIISDKTEVDQKLTASSKTKIKQGLTDKSKSDIIDFLLGLDQPLLFEKLEGFIKSSTSTIIKPEPKKTQVKINSIFGNSDASAINSKTFTHRDDICHICKSNRHQLDYFNFLDEHICETCCTTNPDYRLMSKQDLYAYYKGKVTQKKINTMLGECLYKPQKNLVNPRFKPTKLYMLGHVKKMVNNLS